MKISRQSLRDSKLVLAKFYENQLRIDWEIGEKHAIWVNLTAVECVIYCKYSSKINKEICPVFRQSAQTSKLYNFREFLELLGFEYTFFDMVASEKHLRWILDKCMSFKLLNA